MWRQSGVPGGTFLSESTAHSTELVCTQQRQQQQQPAPKAPTGNFVPPPPAPPSSSSVALGVSATSLNTPLGSPSIHAVGGGVVQPQHTQPPQQQIPQFVAHQLQHQQPTSQQVPQWRVEAARLEQKWADNTAAAVAAVTTTDVDVDPHQQQHHIALGNDPHYQRHLHIQPERDFISTTSDYPVQQRPQHIQSAASVPASVESSVVLTSLPPTPERVTLQQQYQNTAAPPPQHPLQFHLNSSTPTVHHHEDPPQHGGLVRQEEVQQGHQHRDPTASSGYPSAPWERVRHQHQRQAHPTHQNSMGHVVKKRDSSTQMTAFDRDLNPRTTSATSLPHQQQQQQQQQQGHETRADGVPPLPSMSDHLLAKENSHLKERNRSLELEISFLKAQLEESALHKIQQEEKYQEHDKIRRNNIQLQRQLDQEVAAKYQVEVAHASIQGQLSALQQNIAHSQEMQQRHAKLTAPTRRSMSAQREEESNGNEKDSEQKKEMASRFETLYATCSKTLALTLSTANYVQTALRCQGQLLQHLRAFWAEQRHGRSSQAWGSGGASTGNGGGPLPNIPLPLELSDSFQLLLEGNMETSAEMEARLVSLDHVAPLVKRLKETVLHTEQVVVSQLAGLQLLFAAAPPTSPSPAKISRSGRGDHFEANDFRSEPCPEEDKESASPPLAQPQQVTPQQQQKNRTAAAAMHEDTPAFSPSPAPRSVSPAPSAIPLSLMSAASRQRHQQPPEEKVMDSPPEQVSKPAVLSNTPSLTPNTTSPKPKTASEWKRRHQEEINEYYATSKPTQRTVEESQSSPPQQQQQQQQHQPPVVEDEAEGPITRAHSENRRSTSSARTSAGSSGGGINFKEHRAKYKEDKQQREQGIRSGSLNGTTTSSSTSQQRSSSTKHYSGTTPHPSPLLSSSHDPSTPRQGASLNSRRSASGSRGSTTSSAANISKDQHYFKQPKGNFDSPLQSRSGGNGGGGGKNKNSATQSHESSKATIVAVDPLDESTTSSRLVAQGCGYGIRRDTYEADRQEEDASGAWW